MIEIFNIVDGKNRKEADIMNKLKFLKLCMLFACTGILTACRQQEVSDRKKDT